MTEHLGVGGATSLGEQTWLVTGVAGFIGSHLVKSLHALGYDVAGCDKVDPHSGLTSAADAAASSAS